MKRSTLIFVTLSIVASGLSYITYPILAHILPTTQYVNITVSLSLLTQITTFLSSIIALTVGLSKSERHTNTNSKVQVLQSSLLRLFVTLSLIFLVLSPLIMPRLHTPIAFAVPIALMMVFAIPITILSGYLNGRGLLIKLGILTLISALFQFIASIITALLTHNGLVAMLSMTIAQIATILVAYRIFASSNLPSVTTSLRTHATQKDYVRKLVTYALLASLAVMVLNILQIADLLIIQSLKEQSEVKFYTDIYVISRAVFFAGMIFIWPFLGEINIEGHHNNRKPLLKLLLIFTALTLGATGILWGYGNSIAHILFGGHYSLSEVRSIGILSILYKFSFLVITAVVLYFVVLQKYMAVTLSMAVAVCILAYAVLHGSQTSLHTILVWLNAYAGIFGILSLSLVLIPRKTPPT